MPGLETWLSDSNERLPSGSVLTGLDAVGKALVIAAQRRRSSDPFFILLPTKNEARTLVDNLRFFLNEQSDRIHYIPTAEFDFYRGLLPNPSTIMDRNVALFHAFNDSGNRIFVTSVSSLCQKVLPTESFLSAVQSLKRQQESNRDVLIQNLIEAGYQRQPSAIDPGVFTVRGGVLDIFSPLYEEPVRIEWLGDFIEEIRHFDPATQRSSEPIERIDIVPVGQTLMPPLNSFEEISAKIKKRLDDQGVPKARREEILAKLFDRQPSPEQNLLFPLLSKGSALLTEYFPKDCLFFLDDPLKLVSQITEEELPRLHTHFTLYEKEPVPIAAASELIASQEEVEAACLKPFKAIRFEPFESHDTGTAHFPMHSSSIDLSQEREGLHKAITGKSLLEGFAKKFKNWMEEGHRVHVVCHTETHASRLQTLFNPHGIPFELSHAEKNRDELILKSDFSKVHIWQGLISQSVQYPNLRLVMLSEEELWGKKKRSSQKLSKSQTDKLLSSFRDLQIGDFVVHVDHGIGKYLGLKTMQVQGQDAEFVALEYREGDKLYIPIYRLNVLQKYVSGEGASPILDKLGGERWSKVKGKARAAVAELAGELLKIQAERKMIPAHACSPPGEDFQEFEMEFPFDETPDQLKAIEDTGHDLSQSYPMDRLLCGDVGYGKTEVAMRAAYRTVLENKQVAVLVPTTVLAFQHYENFKKRFAPTGSRVEMISRLRTAAQTKQTLEDLKHGKVDVLIGTHRLLSSDIAFRDLGLIVIDEEHRFGVIHKEKLKKMSKSVHVLTMTATPIPRTLNMALMGIKDISIITTPPPDRLSVRTFVSRRTPELIAEAISNELARNGQVFFVHNRIESIYSVGDELKKALPKIKFELVHGQMEADELERKMLAFYRGDCDILLTTSIIESGLDIPRANTIIIDQAHTFGLAQLYQLRGRVGRSEKRAYCYLLIPGETTIGEDAKQRLQVIQRYSELGGGFQVASHDMELRGAGDLLGKDQSGHLTAIGIDMYFDLLEETLRDLRGEEKRVQIEPEISLPMRAAFPEEYLPDISERIQFYRKLSAAESEEEIARAEEEIRDRFGPIPEAVSNLLGLMRIKYYLKKLHVVRMNVGPKKTALQFAESTPASPEKIVQLIQKDPDDRYSLTPDQKLVIEVNSIDWRKQLGELVTLCNHLGVLKEAARL